MSKNIHTIIFDLGGVLVDWNPRYLYNEVFDGDTQKMEWFLSNVCDSDWNENQDAGYPLSKATEDLILKFPEHEKEIKMFYGEWEKMLKGPIPETVHVLKKLIDKKQYKIVALTNWSAETFHIALKRFDFLSWFEGIVVSGVEKTRKPFKEIYEITLDRFNIDNPSHSIFIDDNLRNIKAAQEIGINGIHFTSAEALIKDLKNHHIDI